MVLRDFTARLATLVLLVTAFNDPFRGAVAQDKNAPDKPLFAAADAPNFPTILAEPAKVAKLAFAYKLYPNRRDLKPGAAYPHFTRALLLFMAHSEHQRTQWNQFQEAHEAGNQEIEIEEALKPFDSVLAEVEKFGECEDLTWDDRLRDLSGNELAATLMPEMQHARELARLLRFKCLLHLSKREFDQAFTSIRTGYRLAEFIGQGESIVQQLVGIAICAVMEDCLRQAISTPGCPNLYWAIASIPKPLISCRRSIEVELTGLVKFIPIIAEAQTLTLTPEQWRERWEKEIKEFDAVHGPNLPDGKANLAATFAWTKENGIAEAKKCLVSTGRSIDEINKMPAEQLIALSTSFEIQRLCDDLTKGYCLPMEMRASVLQASQAELASYSSEQPNSIPTMVMDLLAPAVAAVGQAETRSVYFLHRLMNIEALRMHVAIHGELPATLSELDLPAMPNPFDGSDFAYKAIANRGWSAILNCESVPAPPEWLWPIKLKISKPK